MVVLFAPDFTCFTGFFFFATDVFFFLVVFFIFDICIWCFGVLFLLVVAMRCQVHFLRSCGGGWGLGRVLLSFLGGVLWRTLCVVQSRRREIAR